MGNTTASFEDALADALSKLAPDASVPSTGSTPAVAGPACDRGPYRWVVTPVRDPVTNLILYVTMEPISRVEVPEQPT